MKNFTLIFLCLSSLNLFSQYHPAFYVNFKFMGSNYKTTVGFANYVDDGFDYLFTRNEVDEGIDLFELSEMESGRYTLLDKETLKDRIHPRFKGIVDKMIQTDDPLISMKNLIITHDGEWVYYDFVINVMTSGFFTWTKRSETEYRVRVQYHPEKRYFKSSYNKEKFEEFVNIEMFFKFFKLNLEFKID